MGTTPRWFWRKMLYYCRDDVQILASCYTAIFHRGKKKITILCSYMIKKKKKCWLTPNWVMSGKQICLGSVSSTGKEFILPSEHMQNKTF